jgi:hypothetical protein
MRDIPVYKSSTLIVAHGSCLRFMALVPQFQWVEMECRWIESPKIKGPFFILLLTL